MPPKSYKVLDQFCKNCKFCYVPKYYWGKERFFCTYKAPKRPKPCGGIDEAFYDHIPKNVKNIVLYVEQRRARWYVWANKQEVNPCGTCDNFKDAVQL